MTYSGYYSNKVAFLNRHIRDESLSFFFAGVCIFLIPFYTYYVPPFLILWLISRIIETFSRRKVNEKILPANTETLWLTILFTVLFSLQVAGLIYSENLSKGLNIVFSRLSLLIFPLLFIYPGQNIAGRKKSLLKVFAIGTALFIVYSLVYAVIRSTSFIDGKIVFDVHPGKLYWLSYFKGSDFSFNQHPSYTAIFAAFSLLISVDVLIENRNRAAKIFWLITSLVLILSIYLLSSRTGFLVVLITLPSYFFIRIRKEKRTVISAVFIVLLILGSFAIIKTNERMKYYMEEISNGTFLDQTSTDSRILIWESGLNIIQQNLLFGVGVGDVRDELMKQYLALGNEELIKSRYNAHNQFIETTIEGGLISLLVFVSILFYAGYVAIARKDLLLTMFILISVISFMFETVLYRFAGVLYFTSILFVLFQNEQLKANQKT